MLRSRIRGEGKRMASPNSGRKHAGVMAVDDGAAAGGARDRRRQIRTRVSQDGYVRIEDLAEQHDVSVMTVHRDLDLLSSQGWLRKIRGGATSQPSAFHHGDVDHRAKTMAGAKRELAEAALNLVSPGNSVMLDDSTTCLALAERLPSKEPLTVITNFLAAIKVLAGEPGIDLVALGGAYFPAYDAFLGLRTCEAIESLRTDILFMSTTAISEGYCYHQSQETVPVKRALMKAAAKTVLLLDHSKFTKHGLYQLGPLTAFDLVIVDSGTNETQRNSLRSSGVELFVADPSAAPPR
jgi:DeoR/GlpR family transcriptional regulator of sugar metabolism